ncbi:ATP-grasp fold amidoligase family protein [Prevotellamassilia timonensis]|uniref:ATP-grasp fold amidoligase family protein n=1 Tax=Prevotellamassilia timonensis TaxID=1852370 RepID=UPI003FD750FD
MSKLKTMIKLLSNPNEFAIALFNNIVHTGIFNKLNNETFLRLRYYVVFHKRLNLKNPRAFTEKIQWLKLYFLKTEFTNMVDKCSAKEIVKEKVGEEYVIPTLGFWQNFEDIDFAHLPNKFVLKTSHGGGGSGIIICRDKKYFDKNKAKRILEKSMKTDIYKVLREWPYKNVRKGIIAETLVEQSDGQGLLDYKFFCFNGKVKFFKVDFGRFTSHRANYYTREKKLLPWRESNFPSDPQINHHFPENFDEMIAIAEKLSDNLPFLRVDLYNVNGKILFGEMTFYPASGMEEFKPNGVDIEIGDMLTLPKPCIEI